MVVERLRQAAMPPSWPVLRAGIAQLGEGLVAEAGSDPVGFAAVDMAGSIPLIAPPDRRINPKAPQSYEIHSFFTV
jgi:hypothetical protein